MKSLLYTLALVLFTFTLSAQQSQEILSSGYPVDEATGLITYKEVVQEPGNKDTLFNRAASWLHTFYSNPWDVAKVRDQSTGLIKIQHQFEIFDTGADGARTNAGWILYNAKIEFREDRYRVQIDNFVFKQVSRYPVEKWLNKSASDYNPNWESYLSQIDQFSKGLIESLKKKMKPGKVIQEETW